MATQSKLPLSVILGLVDKLTDPWKRVDAKVRMQVRNLGQLGQSWTNNLTNPLRAFGSFAIISKNARERGLTRSRWSDSSTMPA